MADSKVLNLTLAQPFQSGSADTSVSSSWFNANIGEPVFLTTLYLRRSVAQA